MRLRRSTRVILGLMGLALVVGYPAIILFTYPKPVMLRIPDSNGYDDLVRAGKAIAGQEPKFAPQFAQIVRISAGPTMNKYGQSPGTWEPVPAYLEANRKALALLRVGLGHESVVPVVYGPGYYAATQATRKNFEALGQLLLWEARLAIHEDRPADAARSYLDMVRLARAVSRGGIAADAWTGQRLEIGGLNGLGHLRNDLPPADCRQIIAALGDLDATVEPLAAFQARDKAYFDAEWGRFHNTARALTVYKTKAIQDARQADAWDETIALSRMIRIELALRACRVETGSEPATLSALVPNYLSIVPLDPFSGQPPIYRKSGATHVLYCLGADRVDDGGKPPVRSLKAQTTGDLLLDSLFSPLIP